MPEEKVEVEIEGISRGEDVYDKHVDGLRRVKEAQEDASKQSIDTNLKNLTVLQSLQSLQGGITSVTRGFQYFAGSNEAVNKALEGFSAAMNIAIGVMNVAKAASAMLTAVKWGEAAAKIASSGWLAPVVLGIVAAAVGGLIALQARYMATGGAGVVTEPTMFVAGEAGPEYYSFIPAGAGAPVVGGGTNIRTVNVYVTTQDPDAAGQVIADHLRRLKEAGR